MFISSPATHFIVLHAVKYKLFIFLCFNFKLFQRSFGYTMPEHLQIIIPKKLLRINVSCNYKNYAKSVLLFHQYTTIAKI